jgi:large subunit ribosomal protein L17
MRHGKKINHLGRTASHRSALLSNMASSLILNKRITTTVAKAKALRKYVEPLLTKSKEDTTHSRRTVFSYLQNKESVQTLFGEVASKIADRPGGYTRIIKLADTRLGDNAEMALIELVDFNTLYTKDGAEKKGKTRRSRAKGKKAEGAEAESADAPAADAKTEKKAKKTAEPKAEKKSTKKSKE